MKSFLVLCVAVLVLAACSNATQDLANACSGAAASLSSAADLKKLGKLSADSVSKVNIAAQLVNPICTSPTPPVDLSTGISVVTQEAGVVAAIVKGGN